MRKANVAIARKIAVVLHCIWVNGTPISAALFGAKLFSFRRKGYRFRYAKRVKYA